MIRDNAVKIALTSENDQELFEDAVVATDERAELPPAKKNKLKLPPPIARKTYREWNVEELFSPSPAGGITRDDRRRGRGVA
jgi:hypothetical protein